MCASNVCLILFSRGLKPSSFQSPSPLSKRAFLRSGHHPHLNIRTCVHRVCGDPEASPGSSALAKRPIRLQRDLFGGQDAKVVRARGPRAKQVRVQKLHGLGRQHQLLPF